MANLGRLWAGHLYGTNTGKLSADFTAEGNRVSGEIRFMDDEFGPVVYKVEGAFDGSQLTISGDAIQSPDNVKTGTVTAEAKLTAEGQLRGTWKTTLGTGGTLHLFPHDVPASTQRPTLPGSPPEQLHAARRVVGALRLYAGDVRELIDLMKQDFNVGRVIVTYTARGGDITQYAPDFVADFGRLGELRHLQLQIQEHEAYGINRQVVVDLDADDKNEVRVQGVQESWVLGKAEAVSSHLRRSQKVLANTYQRFGVTINGLILLSALVLSPELTVTNRFIFMFAVAAVLWAFTLIHKRFIPNIIVRLSDQQPSPLSKAFPQIVSWLLAASAGLVSMIAYGLLKGELPSFADWLSSIFD